jgi:hypothetical protein
MLSAREVLLSIAGFFAAVSAVGVLTVGALAHLATKNEVRQKANKPAPPSAPFSSTHEVVSR